MSEPTKLGLIEQALEQMLQADEDISARGLVRRLSGLLNHATDITRQPHRRVLVERYRVRQSELRALMARANKNSKANLLAQIARKDAEIAELTRQRNLLIGSHKAMILAIGELGGMKAWRQFFEGYEEIVGEMRKLRAISDAEVLDLPHGQPNGATN